MGVTPERCQEWEDLCKVRQHLTCLSITSDHYQGKSSLLWFANAGWPHFPVMQDLIPKTTKGTYAYQDTQLRTQTPAPEPVVSTLEPDVSTPEPAVLTPSSSKRGFSSLSDAISSSTSSSKKVRRNTPSALTALFGLQTTFQTTLQDFSTQLHGALVRPRVISQAPASDRLLASIESSKLNEGGLWLSQADLFEVLDLFCDNTLSALYVSVANAGKELSRKWVQWQLEHVRVVRASAPGGSEAP